MRFTLRVFATLYGAYDEPCRFVHARPSAGTPQTPWRRSSGGRLRSLEDAPFSIEDARGDPAQAPSRRYLATKVQLAPVAGLLDDRIRLRIERNVLATRWAALARDLFEAATRTRLLRLAAAVGELVVALDEERRTRDGQGYF